MPIVSVGDLNESEGGKLMGCNLSLSTTATEAAACSCNGNNMKEPHVGCATRDPSYRSDMVTRRNHLLQTNCSLDGANCRVEDIPAKAIKFQINPPESMLTDRFTGIAQISHMDMQLLALSLCPAASFGFGTLLILSI